jgi:AcrR family transcriptional regulator
VRTLSRERIAAAALEIAEREGLDAVSMRRLARELAVGPMTLYRYFRSKDELIDAAVDAAAQEVEVNVGGGPWKQELRKLMRAVRETLERHPVGIRLRLTRPILSHGALRITEAGMEILAGAGFDRAGAARAYRALFVYTFGFASFGSPDHPEDIKRHTQAALIALPPDEYPMLSAAASEAAETMAGEAQFEFGLDRLLDGLEAELQRERPARSR